MLTATLNLRLTWTEVWASNAGISTVNTPITLTNVLPALTSISELGIVVRANWATSGFSTISVPVQVRDSGNVWTTRFTFGTTNNTNYFTKNIISGPTSDGINNSYYIVVRFNTNREVVIIENVNSLLHAVVYKLL